jgi:hypothetical protein
MVLELECQFRFAEFTFFFEKTATTLAYLRSHSVKARAWSESTVMMMMSSALQRDNFKLRVSQRVSTSSSSTRDKSLG